jgi:hypothetical protein
MPRPTRRSRPGQPRDETSERDIVFAPNRVDSPTFGKVYQDFMKRRGRSRLESWTCKQTAKPGDLYLFYFGMPVGKVVGLAVCSEPPDPGGWKQSSGKNRQKMFFCAFDRLHHFKSPISVDELQSNGFGSWWQTRPYHGRPKTIPPSVARSLLTFIAKREPKAGPLLREYIDDCGSSNGVSKQTARVDALEGTIYERLARQAVRSRALRDAKICEALRENDGHLICEVPGCGFDFLKVYGEIGRGFAHVHHRKPLARRKSRRTPMTDLAIVCANCHAMIHHRAKCRDLRGLVAS